MSQKSEWDQSPELQEGVAVITFVKHCWDIRIHKSAHRKGGGLPEVNKLFQNACRFIFLNSFRKYWCSPMICKHPLFPRAADRCIRHPLTVAYATAEQYKSCCPPHKPFVLGSGVAEPLVFVSLKGCRASGDSWQWDSKAGRCWGDGTPLLRWETPCATPAFIIPVRYISSHRLFKPGTYNLARRQSRGKVSWLSAKPRGGFPLCQRSPDGLFCLCHVRKMDYSWESVPVLPNDWWVRREGRDWGFLWNSELD